MRLLNGTTGTVGAAMGDDSISCVNNALHIFRRRTLEIQKNDGSALGPLTIPAGTGPRNAVRVTGGMVLALFIPVPTFVALTSDGRVLLSTAPIGGPWNPVGEAPAAAQIALGGGFVEHRLYAQNFDDALFENVGQGCNEYWRFLSPGGVRPDRPTVRAIASSGINRLTVLDDFGSVFHGVIAHERATVVLDATTFAGVNAAIAGSTLRAHQLSAEFNPSPALVGFGLSPESIPLPPGDMSLPLGPTRYSPNDINLAGGAALTLTPSGRNVIFSARFEERDLELLSSNWVYPNINVSSLSGTVTLGAKVGMCGQPEVIATAASFSGNFSGVDNAFSFIVDLLNGDLRAQVQQAMLEGAQTVLAERGTQLGIQRLLLDVADLLAPAPSGAPWSYIVGNTFSVTSSTVRFTVER